MPSFWPLQKSAAQSPEHCVCVLAVHPSGHPGIALHVVSPRRQAGAEHTVQFLVAHTFLAGPGVTQNLGPPHAVQVDATELEHSVQPATFSALTPAHVPPSIRHGVSLSLSHNVHTVPPEQQPSVQAQLLTLHQQVPQQYKQQQQIVAQMQVGLMAAMSQPPAAPQAPPLSTMNMASPRSPEATWRASLGGSSSRSDARLERCAARVRSAAADARNSSAAADARVVCPRVRE